MENGWTSSAELQAEIEALNKRASNQEEKETKRLMLIEKIE